MTQTVLNRFEQSSLIHWDTIPDSAAEKAAVSAARLNAVSVALEEGVMVEPGTPIDAKWRPLTDAELQELSQVDRTVDPWRHCSVEEVIVEEERRRAWHRQCRWLVVSFPVESKPEQPHLRQLTDRQFAILHREGEQTLRIAQTAAAICGGALRRHSFPPREADWLREGLVDSSTCQDCQHTVTRAELLERAANEEKYGTCHVDGDAFVTAGGGLVCPTCTDALRR